MKEELRDLIADIDSSVHKSKLDTLSSIFINEMKEDMINGTEEIYVESMFSAGHIPKNKSYKEYDFIGHNTTQGSNNRQFATSLYTLYRLTRTTHGDNKLKSVGDTYVPRGVANEMKYKMALTLLKECSSLKPNFAKVTYVSENIGTYEKYGEIYKSPVLYVELKLPKGEYMMCIHIPRPSGTDTAKTSKHVKQSKKKRLDNIIELEKYNSPDFTRLGNNDKSKYDDIEKKFKEFKNNRKTGDSMITALINAFDLKGGE